MITPVRHILSVWESFVDLASLQVVLSRELYSDSLWMLHVDNCIADDKAHLQKIVTGERLLR